MVAAVQGLLKSLHFSPQDFPKGSRIYPYVAGDFTDLPRRVPTPEMPATGRLLQGRLV